MFFPLGRCVAKQTSSAGSMLEMGEAEFQSNEAHLSLNKFIRDVLEEKLIISLNPLSMQACFSRRRRRRKGGAGAGAAVSLFAACCKAPQSVTVT